MEHLNRFNSQFILSKSKFERISSRIRKNFLSGWHCALRILISICSCKIKQIGVVLNIELEAQILNIYQFLANILSKIFQFIETIDFFHTVVKNAIP